jgi:hypothetical protein
MNSIANLQSLQNAVYLLSALSPAQNSNQNQESSATATSKSPAQTALSSIYEGKNQTAAAAQSAEEAASIAAASPAAFPISVGAIQTAAQSGGDVWSIQIANGQVTGSFQDNGEAPANAALDYQQYQADLADNSMTSQQLTEAVYSGQGVPTYDGSSNQTFLQSLQGDISSSESTISYAQSIEAWAAEGMPSNIQGNGGDSVVFGGDTPTQVDAIEQTEIAEGAQQVSTYNQIETAYNNHTLTVQNLVDVPGADENLTSTFYSTDTSETETVTGSGTNNAIYTNSPDGLQHTTIGVGYAALYLTW